MFLQNSGAASGVLDNASQITTVVWQSINSLLTSIVARLPHLIAGVIVLMLFWLFALLIRKIFRSASRRTNLDLRLQILFGRLIVAIMSVLGVFTALTIIIPSFSFGDFVAGLGLTSLAIGFAAKDILNNLISGILILWHHPFRIGDYLIMKDEEGWVEHVGVRATSLRRGAGEIVLIPNGDIYTSPFTIRQAGTSYPVSMNFAIGYIGNIDEVKQITRNALLASESVAADPPPKVVITEMTSDGVKISANFRINLHENRPPDAYDEAASNVIESLVAAGVDLYPPTMLLQSADQTGNGHRTQPRRESVR